MVAERHRNVLDGAAKKKSVGNNMECRNTEIVRLTLCSQPIQPRQSCEGRGSKYDRLCLLGSNIPFLQPLGRINIVLLMGRPGV